MFLVIKTQRKSSSLITQYQNSIEKLPVREAVRYKNGNIKWSASEFDVSVNLFIHFS